LIANWLGTKNVAVVAGHGKAKIVRAVGVRELSAEKMSLLA
jgi:hypothetical protein